MEVRGPLGPAGAQLLSLRVSSLLVEGDVTCELHGSVDLGVVEVLARLQLLARRTGRHLTVTGDDQGLLAWTGLEVLGQAEATEQRGVEEVVDVADPPG